MHYLWCCSISGIRSQGKNSHIVFFVNLQSKYLCESKTYASCAYKCENANAFPFFKLKKKKNRQKSTELDHFIDIYNVRSSLHYSQDWALWRLYRFRKYQEHQSASFILSLFLRKIELKYIILALKADVIRHIKNISRKG